MSSAQSKPPDPSDGPTPPDEAPEVEDAYEPAGPADEAVPEDDSELLDSSARSLESEATESTDVDGAGTSVAATTRGRAIDGDEADDAASIPDEPDSAATDTEARQVQDWDHELSSHKVVVELKRVETEVRKLLEGRDGKRKRKLSGSRRWRELEEDILVWRYSSRVDEATLARLHDLIVRRDYLFRRLRFLSATRPTWNT